jgi:hypothetical protein
VREGASELPPVVPGRGDVDNHILVVLTNSTDGDDDVFNDWYTNRHIPDILKLKGFKAAQRFELAGTNDAEEQPPYKYLAIYEVGADDLETGKDSLVWQREERAEAEAAGREPVVPLSPTLHEDRKSWWFSPITEHVEAPGD